MNYIIEKLTDNIYYLNVTFKEFKEREFELKVLYDSFVFTYREKGETSFKEIHIQHNLDKTKIIEGIFEKVPVEGFGRKINSNASFIIKTLN